MASRLTFSDLSTPPLPGGGGSGLMRQYSERFKTLFDASALPLTAVGGTANAVTATLDPPLDGGGLADGMKFEITWGATNTAGVTLALNGGSAIAVLDPSGAALIAGAIGSGLRSLLEYIGGSFRILSPLLTAIGGGSARYYWQFTASGTWNKPAGLDDDTMVTIEAWGGGGSGASSTNGPGGGGGGYSSTRMRIADLPASVSVTVGAGGVVGSNGGNSTFGAILTGYGGGRGGNISGGGGGGGGGELAAGSVGSGTAGGNGGTGGSVSGGTGGSGGNLANAGSPGRGGLWGGGGGGGGATGAGNAGTSGGDAVFGGAGGAGQGASSSGSGGVSLFGGAGGGVGVAGSAPGGAGGRNAAGARGEVRVWI
jgi:hypothetical protein